MGLWEESRPASIGGLLCNNSGELLFMFSKHIEIRDSSETEVFVILEALPYFSKLFLRVFTVKCDSSNVIAWVSNQSAFPWNFQFHFNEICGLSFTLDVVLVMTIRSANFMANALAKWGVDRCLLERKLFLMKVLLPIRKKSSLHSHITECRAADFKDPNRVVSRYDSNVETYI